MSEITAKRLRRLAKNTSMTVAMAMLDAADELHKERSEKDRRSDLVEARHSQDDEVSKLKAELDKHKVESTKYHTTKGRAMSNTPRTDAFEREYYRKVGGESDIEEPIFDFARKLEEELSQQLND